MSRLLACALLAATGICVAACGAGGPAPTTGGTTSAAGGALVAPPRPDAGPSGGTTVYPLTITDDAGRKVTIPAKPKRIVSLTLGTDEILADLVAKTRLVGVTSLASQASMSFVAPQVAGIESFASANAEQVIADKPSVVFAASYTTPGVIAQLTAAGIPVVEFNTFSSFANIESHIATIARITDDQGRGQAIVGAMQREIAAVGKAVAKLPKPRAVFYSGGYLFGSGTTMDQLIQDAGGVNAASAAGIKSWAQVGPEEIVTLNPAVVMTDDTGSGDIFQGPVVHKFLADPVYQTVQAVKSWDVWGMSTRADSDVSQYMAWDLQDVAHILHPHHVPAYSGA